jgi:hypothetical protein
MHAHNICTQIVIHVHTYEHTHTHARVHTHTHTHIKDNTPTHPHTHTHTHNHRAAQLAELASMGFNDVKVNVQLLDRYQGRLLRVINSLSEMPY